MSPNFLITVKALSKHYYANGKLFKEALKNLSLSIYRGEILGLLGVNGAGKTTLASIIATLHPPSAGDIFWRGISIYTQLLEYRKIVGFCPQTHNLDKKLSLEEILLFSGRSYGLSRIEAEKQKEKLLDQFTLREYARATVEQISGGYRQRFLIARSLMHHPQLVILDEPTVGLDPHVRRELWKMILELKSQGISVLLTTHYLDEAEALSDRVCLLHNGTLCTIDSPTNLKKIHQKANLEEVFLKFVGDPEAEIFNVDSRGEAL